MFMYIKKKWNEKGCFYRTARTFLQTLFATLISDIAMFAGDTAEFTFKAVLTTAIIPILSALLSALMNLAGNCSETDKK